MCQQEVWLRIHAHRFFSPFQEDGPLTHPMGSECVSREPFSFWSDQDLSPDSPLVSQGSEDAHQAVCAQEALLRATSTHKRPTRAGKRAGRTPAVSMVRAVAPIMTSTNPQAARGV